MGHPLITAAEMVLERLTAIETEIARLQEELPPGAVRARYIRCGRPTCRCRNGELHGPYYVARRREAGRVRETYLGRELPQKRSSRREMLARLRALSRERERVLHAIEQAADILRHATL